MGRLVEAFKVADSVLGQAVGGIAEIITTPGLVNVDFADVRTIMKDAGTALLGIGTGVGENRAQMAARAAISSPLLDLTIEGARGVLFNIAGGSDMTMFEVDEAAKIIASATDTDANIIFGAVVKEELSDQLRITVIATGFDETQARLAQISKPHQPSSFGLMGDLTPDKMDEDDGKKEQKGKEDKITFGDEDDDEKTENEDTFGSKFEIPAFLRKIT